MISAAGRYLLVLIALLVIYTGTPYSGLPGQAWDRFFSAGFLMPLAHATRLSPEHSKAVLGIFKDGKVRIDGSVQMPGDELYLLLLSPAAAKKGKSADIEQVVPEQKAPDVVFYANGTAHVRLLRKGEASTLAIPSGFNEKQRKRLLGLKLPSDLIVPDGFVLPRSLKPLAADLPTVSLVDDALVSGPNFGVKARPVTARAANYKGSGSVFLTSVTSGSITMLDGKNFNKIAEFPTEGTPCGMELVNGQLYIADQAKNRVLIMDPLTRKFAGQIDLLPKTGPKGIAVLPNGSYMYVSESAANDIAVIETATGKVLVKTRVRPGPGRIALTPDSTFLLILNVTAGELTFLSTFNQKVITIVKVGDMPTGLVVANNGKFAFVSNRVSNTVSVVDLARRQVTGTVKCGQSPTGVAVSPDDSKLYVASGRDNNITIFDTASLSKLNEVHLPVGVDFPGLIFMMPGGQQLLVTNQQSDVLAVLDTDKLEFSKQVSLGHPNHDVVWEPVP